MKVFNLLSKMFYENPDLCILIFLFGVLVGLFICFVFAVLEHKHQKNLNSSNPYTF